MSEDSSLATTLYCEPIKNLFAVRTAIEQKMCDSFEKYDTKTDVK